MTHEPTTQDRIFESLKARMTGRTEKLTHFEPGSVNHTLAYHGYAGYFSLFEHGLLAVQLSGWVDYAGGPIDEDDLVRLDIPIGSVDLDLLNEYMHDSDLDELAARDGITRDPGDRAEGNVLFLTTGDDVVIPAGTRVATARDRFDGGQQREYATTEEVTPDEGTTGAVAPVEAIEIGPHYNVGPGAVEIMPSPPSGVRDVTNQEPISGGEPPETNAELRERIKKSVTYQSGGGTSDGIRGGLVDMIDGLDDDDIYIQEHYNPPSGANYVEVTVDGGDDRLVEDAIEYLHPTGIRHILNRPTTYHVDVTVTLEGSPINVERTEGEIARFFSERGIGEDINRAKLIQSIMNADDDTENITELILRTDEHGVIEGDFVIEPDEKARAGAIEVDA